MKPTLILVLLILNSYAFAKSATVQIQDICSNKVLYSFSQQFVGETSVSEMTLKSFTENMIPFLGAKEGLNSILGTPTGLEALEVLSDTQMRAYGWCFTVDGNLSPEMMHQTFIEDDATITWFYGFTFYDAGEWSGICTPAHTVSKCNTLF